MGWNFQRIWSGQITTSLNFAERAGMFRNTIVALALATWRRRKKAANVDA
jgi:hypothetical protein